MEEWRAVVGFEGLYEVSSKGHVRGVPRRIGHYSGQQRLWPGKVLKRSVGTHGYYTVTLCKKGKHHQRTVHSLVCEAFRGEAPEGHWVAHADGDRLNCDEKNLSWKTPIGNSADTARHGRDNKGSRNGMSKLTEGCVSRVRDLHRAGCEREDIAAWLGVSTASIGNVLAGRTWSHI